METEKPLEGEIGTLETVKIMGLIAFDKAKDLSVKAKDLSLKAYDTVGTFVAKHKKESKETDVVPEEKEEEEEEQNEKSLDEKIRDKLEDSGIVGQKPLTTRVVNVVKDIGHKASDIGHNVSDKVVGLLHLGKAKEEKVKDDSDSMDTSEGEKDTSEGEKDTSEGEKLKEESDIINDKAQDKNKDFELSGDKNKDFELSGDKFSNSNSNWEEAESMRKIT